MSLHDSIRCLELIKQLCKKEKDQRTPCRIGCKSSSSSLTGAPLCVFYVINEDQSSLDLSKTDLGAVLVVVVVCTG